MIKRVQWYLGNECYQDKLMDVSDPNEAAWLESFISDTKTNHHPSVKLVVTTLAETNREVIRPTSPSSLAEILD